jgi:hypothetical protein
MAQHFPAASWLSQHLILNESFLGNSIFFHWHLQTSANQHEGRLDILEKEKFGPTFMEFNNREAERTKWKLLKLPKAM